MGIAGELVLEGARDREAKARQHFLRPRDGFQFISNLAGRRIELKQETFFALLDVHLCCGVDKPKSRGGIDYFSDSAKIQRPQAQRMHFDRD